MSLESRLPAWFSVFKILPMSVKDSWPFSGDEKRQGHAWVGRSAEAWQMVLD